MPTINPTTMLDSEIEVESCGFGLVVYTYRGRFIGMKDLRLEERKDESERIDWENFTYFGGLPNANP